MTHPPGTPPPDPHDGSPSDEHPRPAEGAEEPTQPLTGPAPQQPDASGWQPQWQPGWQPNGPGGYGPPNYQQGYPPAGYPQPGYAQPGYGAVPPGPPPGWYAGPPPYRLPEHPEATKALVVGIIALLGGFTCYLPLLLGPWAWIAGRRAVRQIDAEPGRWDGRGQAMGGYVMGVVATVLLALGVLAVVAFILFATGMVMWGSPDPVQGQSF